MSKGLAWSFALVSMSLSAQVLPTLSPETNITRLAFGSCNDQRDAQPLWKDMLSMKPDLFIWGGDAIYADWDDRYDIARSYQKQLSVPAYQDVRREIPIFGTWDDHDYGFDNADGTLTKKAESKRLFLDFLGEPTDSPRRTRDGIYTSYEFGEASKKVKIILLDNRYFKNLETSASMLGETQWQWLESELKTSTASLHFIVTGLSIYSPLLPYSEEWAEQPSEINRMLKLMKTYKPKGAVFLTGDKHFGSIFQNYGQLEMMSSGMTHVAPRKTWWYLGRKYPNAFFGLNYGLIDIDWDGSTPIIHTAFRGISGQNITPRKYKWVNNTWQSI